ncbi:helix-turn-helix domain-containing protein [Dyadobacter sp. MSC1_007]|uniref:helix-turn-helix domain-containing protein n=1 Tax=Dyadobacter sp. MSC1_007 TaxID=2909264 RepID=UPI00202EDC26|nr:helix-turn-helix transcriptional regulator [Dyadobacter sp. MSC1_007]
MKNLEVADEYADLFSSSPEEKNKLDALILAARFLEIVSSEMKQQNMTRKALAAAMGTSASWLTQLFRGDKLPNLETLILMGRILGLSFEVRSTKISNDANSDNGSQINNLRKLDSKRPPFQNIEMSTGRQ